MRTKARALIRACLLASLPLCAVAQAPVIVEAEDGTLGSSLSIATLGSDTYITGLNGTTNPTPDRTATYQVVFPAPGNYALYVRIRVGPDTGGNDDSFYIPNGFDSLAWTGLYNTGSGGFTAPGATVIVGGTAGQQVWKWVRLTNMPGEAGGIGPGNWVVPAGALTQTFSWGSREDGLFFDKLAFAPQGVCYTVAELNEGLPGTAVCPEPPPPPPPAYTNPGPPIATGKSKFLGSAWSPGAANQNFAAYWNKVTPENGGKWGSVEGQRDVYNWADADAAYQLAQTNGWPFQWHVLFWGNQQPAWLQNLSTAEQLEEIHEWLAAIAARYPNIDILEVVNEPLHDPPLDTRVDPVPGSACGGCGNYLAALGQTGPVGSPQEWDWIVNAFRLAKQYFPNAKLMLNDYSIVNESNQTLRYAEIVNLLRAENLIDVIGIQGHAFSLSEAAPMPSFRRNIDKLLHLTGNLPIHVTEFDVDGTTDAIQLATMQKVFPIFWDHPGITGITLWGYRQGNHWRNAQGAWLMYQNGAERPALKYIQGYVHNTLAAITFDQVFNVDANAAVGTTIGTIVATDSDPETVFSQWTKTGRDGLDTVPGFNAVSVNPTTGAITVADSAGLSALKGKSFKIHVTVFDGFHVSPESRVRIVVN